MPLWLGQHTNQPVYQFKLLRSRFLQKTLDAFTDISFVVFSFKRQEYSRGKAKSFRHCNDRIETRDFLLAFDVPPKIGGNICAFCGFFKTKLGILSESANSFGELGAMFQAVALSQDSEHADVATQSIECFIS